MFMLADFFLTIASQVGPRLLAGRAVGLLLGHGDSGFWPGPAKATLQPRRESARALAGNGMEPYRQVYYQSDIFTGVRRGISGCAVRRPSLPPSLPPGGSGGRPG